jgi:hypothetical protein
MVPFEQAASPVPLETVTMCGCALSSLRAKLALAFVAHDSVCR